MKNKYWLVLIVCFLLGTVSFIAFFWGLGAIGLIDKTEPMFVEAARQMVVTGDWITPYWNDATRFDKPPLSYWFMGLSMQLFGISEISARLPSAMLACAVVFLVVYVLRYFSPGRLSGMRLWLGACVGGGMMALNPAWIAWARTGVSDMYLSAMFTIALIAFFIAYAGKPIHKRYWYWGFYLAIALAVLSKGPVGIVLPVLIVGTFLWYVGQLRSTLKEMQLLQGLAIIAVVTLPWFVAITQVHGQEYINNFFGYHNIQRYTSVVSNHPGPWYYFFPVIFVGLIPWSSYLPLAIARLEFWKRRYWQKQGRQQQLGLFCLFWLGTVFIFFSLSSTKLPSYILPSMAAGIILIALLWLEQLSPGAINKKSTPFIISTVIYILFLVALAIASFIAPSLLGDNPLTPGIEAALQNSGLLLRGSWLWAITSLMTLILLTKKQWWPWLWATGIVAWWSFLAFSGIPTLKIVDQYLQLPLRQLATTVIELRQPGEELLMVGFIRPSLVFYTRQPVIFTFASDAALDHLHQTQTDSALMIIEQDYALAIPPEEYTTKVLKNYGAYQLLRVEKQHS